MGSGSGTHCLSLSPAEPIASPGRELARAAYAAAQQAEPSPLWWAVFDLGFALLWHGDLDEATVVLRESLAEAKRICGLKDPLLERRRVRRACAQRFHSKRHLFHLAAEDLCFRHRSSGGLFGVLELCAKPTVFRHQLLECHHRGSFRTGS